MATTTSGRDGERNLAVYIDFENLALGFEGNRNQFDIGRVLDRLLEKGKVIVKVAYADWSRFRNFTKVLHEHGIALTEIPKRSMTGKNSADIRLVVDAMDMSYSKDHIDTFVIVSGDSDFSPLVAKLKENGKYVIGLGMRQSTSKLLADHCDEFIFYEELEAESPSLPTSSGSGDEKEAFALLVDAARAIIRENELALASRIKETIKRKRPSFSESGYGYRSFSELMEDAEEAGLVELKVDDLSGTLVVTKVKGGGRRRGRRGGRGGGKSGGKVAAKSG
ncbi:MAG TPA: NYN domain-containing protein [bacterium]|nr:NYN domain-containing protein [bacterium]